MISSLVWISCQIIHEMEITAIISKLVCYSGIVIPYSNFFGDKARIRGYLKGESLPGLAQLLFITLENNFRHTIWSIGLSRPVSSLSKKLQ